MDDEVTLRPLREADLDSSDRFSVEPEAMGPFEWFGFRSTKTRRERWAQDRWIGQESTMLGVTADDARDRQREHARATCIGAVGLQREGIMREAVFRDGRWRDLVMYSILRRSMTCSRDH